MNQLERMLVEAIGNMFKHQDKNLGIVPPKHPEITHRYQFQWSNIEDMFALKTSDSPFSESLTAAFHDIHSYKYLDDPTFPIALDKRLSATGVPMTERQQALKYVNEIIEDLKREGHFQEKETGWHPQLDEIAEMTRNADSRKAENTTPYTGGGAAPDRNELK